ncbi:nucleotide-diphospho-sugar transferase [Penicillium macrosclerotiorum]|uniref:nucleotide-diphospho-sugar transferase n=1 Tax=Penicillium macrosclerotiorum TaxID=303699 RepID=UPI002549861D|nr:nucleotide-diphospho-sugar transferase [Penicillium macrosclerotiorum]KAJ5688806.1 nucleotide-diphospho-sugar transferase [Penicillium macrosclerotiorum]
MKPQIGTLSANSTFPVEALGRGAEPAPTKYAFATILTAEGDLEFPDIKEPYLRAARLLTYQLLHNPKTRNESYGIPLLVLATPGVPKGHLEILRNDGATVMPVETLHRDWIHPKWDRWGDVLAKLNLWTLEEYEKIAFLDADSIIFHPIHEIFEVQATDIRPTRLSNTNGTVHPDLIDKLPPEYMIAGTHDLWIEQYMPPPENMVFYEAGSYVNAGFFVLSPSKAMFDYYDAILDIPQQFEPNYPEQNLLNYAHRSNGPMPWQSVGSEWNSKWPTEQNLQNGLKSIHHKWWRPISDTYVGECIADAVQEMEIYLNRTNESS